MSGIPQRVRSAWAAVDRDQRFAGIAAGALLFTMFLPWYEKNAYDSESKRFVTDSVSAFGVISFIEAAIFLVAAGVLVLILARGERRSFKLPGGDGTIIFAAGLWAAVLIFYRVFDRPEVSGQAGTVGIQWGFFAAFVAAGALAFAGQRIRVASRSAPAADDAAPATASSETGTAVAPVAADEQRTAVVPSSEAVTNAATRQQRRARRAVTREDAEQLTFDEPPEPPPLRPGEIPPARDRS